MRITRSETAIGDGCTALFDALEGFHFTAHDGDDIVAEGLHVGLATGPHGTPCVQLEHVETGTIALIDIASDVELRFT